MIYLEARGAPIDKLNGSLGLDGGDGSVDIFGDDVPAIKQAAGHVFAVTRVAFHHLCGEVREGGEKRNGVRWGDGAGKKGRSGGGEMEMGGN